MKKLLSIILASSMICCSAYAAPVMVSGVESTAEIVEELPFENYDSEALSEHSSIRMAYVTESIQETAANEKPANVMEGDALLMTEEFSGGDGSAEAPYEISNADDLELFSKNINSGIGIRSHYKLTGNIDLDGREWTPVGYFTVNNKYETAFQGSFDGCGYTVSNFKITENDTPYIGFFGLILNGEVKNLKLDSVTVDVDRTGTDSEVLQSFASVLAGRMLGDGIGGKCTLTNCHVTNSSVSVKYDKDTYAGGLVGFMLAGINAECEIFNVSADCDVYASVSASEYKDSKGVVPTPYQAYVSSLLGYLGALNDGSFSLRKASSEGNVTADCLVSPYVTVFAGGIVAQTATKVTGQVGGTAVITACQSSANVTATAQLCVFAGGLAGSIASTENFKISDCYFSGDIKAGSYGVYWYRYYDHNAEEQKVYGYSALGGFAGQIDFEGYTASMGKLISECYASGDVIYTPVENANHEESYEGGFTGFSFAPIFGNCYILEDQTVTGLEIFNDSSIVLVSSEASKTQEGYPGFDFDSTWTFDSSSDYPYPVLKDITGVVSFYNEGKLFKENYFGSDGKAYAPAAVPTKKADVQYVYTFSHWSLTQNGEAFDFENEILQSDTSLYAVYSAEKQVYKVSFVSDGNPFGEVLEVPYGNTVNLPSDIPSKPDSGKFRYEFDYWSLSDGGSEVDFDTYTVTGNVTLYAVFLEINKTAWQGAVAKRFSDGYGTKALPYIISNAEEFALFAKVINEGNEDYARAYFALGNDIHLGYNHWTPVGTDDQAPFGAYLDGNGYSVSCFTVEGTDYAGLFGYICNGSVKNLIVSDFDIDYDGYTTQENLYAGGLAGYIESDGKEALSVIDKVYVSPAKFQITASANNIYAGSIAGYINTNIACKSLVTDSYASGDISVTNTADGRHVYAGGLFGYMYTFSLSLAKASSCYFTGSVAAYSDSDCYAGGIAGLVDSYGSWFLPPVSTDASLDAEIVDYDIMLENCFAAADVSSTVSGQSEIAKAYAGAIAADIYMHARTSNVYYQRNRRTISSTNTIYTDGFTSVAETSLTSKAFVSGTVGFDFSSTWTYISGVKYPVLKVMYTDKPILRIDSLSLEDGVLSAKVTSFSSVPSYTVVVAVYNERNQLIASRRMTYKSSLSANELSVQFDGLRQPYRIKVSAMETSSFIPLFTAVERYI